MALKKNMLGFSTDSWIGSQAKSSGKKLGYLFYLQGAKNSWKKSLSQYLEDWQIKEIAESPSELAFYSTQSGPVWVIMAKHPKGAKSHSGLMDRSEYTAARDLISLNIPKVLSMGLDQLQIHFEGAKNSEIMGGLVGLEMAAYRFNDCFKETKRKLPQLKFFKGGKAYKDKSIQRATHLGVGTNLARHLVNLPANELNPKTYSEFLKTIFSGQKNFKVEVWDGNRLKKENMGLHWAVGKAAEEGPCMVHLKYRPPGSSSKKPTAFVGKGITYDTGGLDLKPAQYMRNMKKDMGGSAAVAGLAYYVLKEQIKQPMDFYFAIAENAVAGNAFRPGDILTSRKGTRVEIHNTDAEGRLVLADVLDVAVTKKAKDAPGLVVDVATLTGAIKATLGSGVGGLFSNSDKDAEKLLKSSQQSGDRLWRIPLIPDYKSQLNSTPADMVNCGDGFGGAVTAALFLEHFVGSLPWIHLDIYAWKDKPGGGCMESGGSGQGVQSLSFFVDSNLK